MRHCVLASSVRLMRMLEPETTSDEKDEGIAKQLHTESTVRTANLFH